MSSLRPQKPHPNHARSITRVDGSAFHHNAFHNVFDLTAGPEVQFANKCRRCIRLLRWIADVRGYVRKQVI